jgi:hypothetical protein
MGAGCVVVGILILVSKQSKIYYSKNFYCYGLGFFHLVVALLEVRLKRQAQVPLFILILFTLM